MDAVIVAAMACLAIALMAANAAEFWRRGALTRQLVRLGKKARSASPQQLREDGALRSEMQIKGVYILRNQTKNKCYVGQAERVAERVMRHFAGRGSEGVYKDYIRGDKFVVKAIPIKGTGFRSLNEMERCAIKAYKSFAKGYNKTRGNR